MDSAHNRQICGHSSVTKRSQEWGVCKISMKKSFEGERFNVISITRGWVGVNFPEIKGYVTLE